MAQVSNRHVQKVACQVHQTKLEDGSNSFGTDNITVTYSWQFYYSAGVYIPIFRSLMPLYIRKLFQRRLGVNMQTKYLKERHMTYQGVKHVAA